MRQPTVLITGANRGLGLALAIEFKSAGYNLLLHRRQEDTFGNEYNGFELEKKRNPQFKCEVIHGDLRFNDALNTIVATAKFADIDVLINNAGVYWHGAFDEISEAMIRNIIEVNLVAPMLLIRNLWPIFKKKKSGLIININTIAGKIGSEDEAAYSASKHGLRGLTSSLQYDATRDNIRIINVTLGAMRTDMARGKKEQDKLINPKDAATFIVRLAHEYTTLRVAEIELGRMIY